MAVNENDNDYNRLEELGGSDFKIAEGQPNIKGWKVKNSAGRKYGEVDELIFNPASRKVRYMVLDLDDNELNLNSRKVLLPIGLAQLHEEDDDVFLPGITLEQLQGLPEYVKDQITPASELRLRNLLAGSGAAGIGDSADYTYHEEGFYEHDHFDEDRFYGKRRPSSSEPFNRTENPELGNRDQRNRSSGLDQPDEDPLNRRDDLL